MVEHISWATALRLLANLLTATTALAWLRFADSRDGVLSSPNLHHRVYLRALIGLSVAAFTAGLLSLAATAHAGAPLRGHAASTTERRQADGLAAIPPAREAVHTPAGDASAADRR